MMIGLVRLILEKNKIIIYDFVFHNSKWIISNGQTVSFWSDAGILHSSIFQYFGIPKSLNCKLKSKVCEKLGINCYHFHYHYLKS